MTPKIKYYFFDARARGEISRLILAAAKVDYEFIQIEFENWANDSKETPFGKLPVLEMEGKKHAQSIAVASYLAEEYGLYGSSSMDRLIINQLQGLAEESINYEGTRFHEPDPQKKIEIGESLFDVYFPKYLNHFNNFIKEYGQGRDFMLGDKVSLADIVVYAATTTVAQDMPDMVSKYPEVERLRKNVSQVDGIKEFLDTRGVRDI